MEFIDHLINALGQLLVFTLIPFVVYLIRFKKVKGFFSYIGLKKSTRKANALAFLIVILLAAPMLTLAYFDSGFREVITGPTSMIGKFKDQGLQLSVLIILIIDAGIKTSLSEEILFRGFLAKRLISISGFQTGNILQAVIFGAVHALLFSLLTNNILYLTVIFIFPTVGAYFKTYLNEKLAGGSIIPGWIAHGVGNFTAYSLGMIIF